MNGKTNWILWVLVVVTVLFSPLLCGGGAVRAEEGAQCVIVVSGVDSPQATKAEKRELATDVALLRRQIHDGVVDMDVLAPVCMATDAAVFVRSAQLPKTQTLEKCVRDEGCMREVLSQKKVGRVMAVLSLQLTRLDSGKDHLSFMLYRRGTGFDQGATSQDGEIDLVDSTQAASKVIAAMTPPTPSPNVAQPAQDGVQPATPPVLTETTETGPATDCTGVKKATWEENLAAAKEYQKRGMWSMAVQTALMTRDCYGINSLSKQSYKLHELLGDIYYKELSQVLEAKAAYERAAILATTEEEKAVVKLQLDDIASKFMAIVVQPAGSNVKLELSCNGVINLAKKHAMEVIIARVQHDRGIAPFPAYWPKWGSGGTEGECTLTGGASTTVREGGTVIIFYSLQEDSGPMAHLVWTGATVYGPSAGDSQGSPAGISGGVMYLNKGDPSAGFHYQLGAELGYWRTMTTLQDLNRDVIGQIDLFPVYGRFGYKRAYISARLGLGLGTEGGSEVGFSGALGLGIQLSKYLNAEWQVRLTAGTVAFVWLPISIGGRAGGVQ